MSAALTSRASLPPMWEASSRTIRTLRLAFVSEARCLGYAILALIFELALGLSLRGFSRN